MPLVQLNKNLAVPAPFPPFLFNLLVLFQRTGLIKQLFMVI